jgi:hypothetical protein
MPWCWACPMMPMKSNYITEFAYTDDAGNYAMNLFCNQEYGVVDYLGLIQNIFCSG